MFHDMFVYESIPDDDDMFVFTICLFISPDFTSLQDLDGNLLDTLDTLVFIE
jgi:hypothetical protein